jgi:hypothetical protein
VAQVSEQSQTVRVWAQLRPAPWAFTAEALATSHEPAVPVNEALSSLVAVVGLDAIQLGAGQ